MKKLFLKSGLYVVLVLLALELLVRVFHLTKDYPSRYVDEFGVEKWRPNQEGYSVTGIRRQNFSKYHINNSGFNSYREFVPTMDKRELALVGDSFIEGFHQHYYNSIGKKIENQVSGLEVYEYGYAGYDFADQLHLIHAYKDIFSNIDHVVLGLKFENDLTRSEYQVLQERMNLESPLYKNLRKIKLLVYAQNSGALTPVKNMVSKLFSLGKKQGQTNARPDRNSNNPSVRDSIYFNNFKQLVAAYGYDKHRFILLLDGSVTPAFFLDYLNKNHFEYIDFHKTLASSKKPTTLIYDRHWNDHGRNIIANLISSYIKTKQGY